MKSERKRLSPAIPIYILIFLLGVVLTSYVQERTARRELLHRFDLAASQLDGALYEIENRALFIGELPAVSEAVNQQAYRLRTYLGLGEELDALQNVTKFKEIRLIHWSSRKVYQANYGIYDLARLTIPAEMRRAQSGGFYYSPGEVFYYLPLPTSGRQPTALLQLDLEPGELFSYFRDLPVEIIVGDATYINHHETHPLDRWIVMEPTTSLSATWQEDETQFRLKIPGEVIVWSVLKGLAMAIVTAILIYIVVRLRTRRTQMLLESNRRDLSLLLAEGGEALEVQNLESLIAYLRESYLGLIQKNREQEVLNLAQQTLIDDLRASRRELRRLALSRRNRESSLTPVAGLWLEVSADQKEELKAALTTLDPEGSEVYKIDDSFYVLFYPMVGEGSGDKRAYGVYYGLEGLKDSEGDEIPIGAVIIGAEYFTMPEERLIRRAGELLVDKPRPVLIRFEDEEWLGELQYVADSGLLFEAYVKALVAGEATEQSLEALLDLRLLDHGLLDHGLAGISNARELSEEILTRLRQLDYPYGDRTYPEFITAVLILERQQSLAEVDFSETQVKLRQIFQSWDERMQKAARRSEEKSDVLVHVERALELMHQRFREPELSVGEIADTLALNPVYFGRIFKDVTQQTPSEYLTGLRLQAAKKLLLEGKDSLVIIAEQAGFNDQRSFARFFKKEMGVPPSQWKPPSH